MRSECSRVPIQKPALLLTVMLPLDVGQVDAWSRLAASSLLRLLCATTGSSVIPTLHAEHAGTHLSDTSAMLRVQAGLFARFDLRAAAHQFVKRVRHIEQHPVINHVLVILLQDG